MVYSAFASPIFETNTTITGAGNFLPEQSINVKFDSVTNMDVAVDDIGVHVIWIDGASGQVPSLFYQYTDDTILEPATGDPYFLDIFGMVHVQPSAVSDSSSECNAASKPKIDVSNTHIFIAWIDQQDANCDAIPDGTTRIGMVAIDKLSGPPYSYDISVNSPVYHDTAFLPTTFSMDASGQFAYIVWHEDGIDSDIDFLRFDGNAFINSIQSIDSVQTLDTTLSNANPDVLASPTGLVYVVWEDTDNNDIKFAYDSLIFPLTFTTNSIDVNSSTMSQSPKLAEDIDAPTSVYVAWIEGPTTNNQIHVAKFLSTDLTTVSSTSVVSSNLGSSINHQISATGNDVFVVWQDNLDGSPANEILFSKSTDAGSTFLPPVNISNSSGDSLHPKMAISSSDLHIAWRDDTFANDPFNQILGQVWLRSSSDKGATFGGLEIISEATTDAQNTLSAAALAYPVPVPNIAASDNIVVAVWSPDVLLAPTLGLFAWDGSFKVGVPSTIDVSFDKTEYSVFDTAIVTIINPSLSGSGSITADVTNVDLGLTITETLKETSLGIFSASLDLDTTYSAALGDLFRVDYDTTGSGPNLVSFSKVLDPRSISFSPSGPSFDLGDFVGFTVNDQNGNLDPSSIDSITVTITSPTDSVGVNIVLDETSIDSGIFSGSSNIVFMNGPITPLITDQVTITQNDNTSPDPGLVQTVTRNISSTSDSIGININLTETGIDSNVYSSTFTFCNTSGCSNSSAKKLEGSSGDFITLATLGGTIRSNGMIFPDNIHDRGALLVSCILSTCDIITASYNGLSISASIGDAFAPGGGGGGISRAGLVFNAAGGASLFAGGSGIDVTPPAIALGSLTSVKSFEMPDDIRILVENHNPESILRSYNIDAYNEFSFPLVINSNGFALGGFENTIETQTVETNELVKIELTIYENSDIQHISIFTNLSGGLPQHSDTEIAYDKNNGIDLRDPNELIRDVSFSLKEEDFKKKGVFEIIFSKPMIKSDVIVRSWDDNLQSMDIFVRDAIEVVPSDFYQENLVEKIIEQKSEVIKSDIMDELPKEIPVIPEWIKTTTMWWSEDIITDDAFLKAIQFLVQEEVVKIPFTISESNSFVNHAIPDWIRNTASWWVDNSISDKEFITAIQYLIKNGVIVV